LPVVPHGHGQHQYLLSFPTRRSSDLNRRIARYGRKRGLRVFYYIPPKVWAWYQRRAWELKSNVSKLFVILPFEKKFYKRFDWDRSEEHTSELQSRENLVCRLLLEKKK